MRKKLLSLLLLTVATSMLTGCGAQGRLYGKSKVLEYMEENVPREEFTFEKMEKVDDAEVSTEIYYFSSKERNLDFIAQNTRSSVFPDSAVYGRTIISKYVEGVHDLYKEDVESIISGSGLTIDGEKIFIESYEDIVRLTEYLAAADDVYKGELNYNSAEWLMANPLAKYNLCKMEQKENSDAVRVNFGSIKVNGTWDNDKLLDYVSFCYASAIKEGRIEDLSLPEKYKDAAHISTLHNIYLNGVNISETAHSTAKKKHLNNNSDSMYYSGYCYKLEDYVIPLNVGLTDDGYAPQMLEEIFGLLNIDYEIKYGRGIVSWKTNGEKWEISAKESDNEIQSVVIKKNGRVENIPYVICGEWTSPISGTYVAGIRATDFADIFGLKMQVDESEDCISFEK